MDKASINMKCKSAGEKKPKCPINNKRNFVKHTGRRRGVGFYLNLTAARAWKNFFTQFLLKIIDTSNHWVTVFIRQSSKRHQFPDSDIQTLPQYIVCRRTRGLPCDFFFFFFEADVNWMSAFKIFKISRPDLPTPMVLSKGFMRIGIRPRNHLYGWTQFSLHVKFFFSHVSPGPSLDFYLSY